MTVYQIPRTGDVDLLVEGRLLAEGDSWRQGSERWTEIRIYRTVTDRWVTEMVGRSTVRGETDRRTVVVHDDVSTIREGLKREGDQGVYLTRLAQDTLATAAENDPLLVDILVDRA